MSQVNWRIEFIWAMNSRSTQRRPFNKLSFHFSSFFENGWADWNGVVDGHCRSPPKSFSFFSFHLLKRNEIEKELKRLKAERAESEWNGGWFGLLFGFACAVRAGTAAPQKKRQTKTNKPTQRKVAEFIEEERRELVNLLKWNENKDSSSPGMTKWMKRQGKER